SIQGGRFFDCVLPARNGRHGQVFTSTGKVNLTNKKFELDDNPIDEKCFCEACKNYSRAYIRHLFKAKEMLAMRLCVLHNLNFYNKLLEEIRKSIELNQFSAFKNQKFREWGIR
ncbi:Queuine tRNA-ribosyltransferase, partial [Candidatus Arthromitus sp. SFB-3]